MKNIKYYYWTAIIIFALLMFLDGIGGVTRQQAGVDVMKQLGYPVYILTIVGIAKLLGAMAILQNKFKILKEWAFAGFTVNFYGASMSWFFVVGFSFEAIFPWIIFGIMLIPYLLWKRYEILSKNYYDEKLR